MGLFTTVALSHNHALSNKEVEKEVGKVRQRWVNLCKFNAVLLASRLSLEQWPGRPRSQKLGESRLGRLYIYIALHCHHQNDFCIKMGSGESHFNVSVGIFEEKGEPKRYRTEVLPLSILTPYR